MNINSRCMVCQVNSLGRQILDLNLPEEKKFALMQDMFDLFARCEKDMPSPEVYMILWERILKANGGIDPLLDAKRKDDELCLSLLPAIQREIDAAKDKFDAAMRFAIAANVFDPMPQHGMTVDQALKKSAGSPLYVDDSKKLLERLQKADRILYLTDNAGEIAVDRLFLENLFRLGITAPEKVTVAVRGSSASNDATMEDAERVGLTRLVKVIGTGNSAMGILLNHCSDEFMEALNAADIVVSKGMGNFESLHDWQGKPIAFLFITKCRTVAELSNSPVGSFLCVLKNA